MFRSYLPYCFALHEKSFRTLANECMAVSQVRQAMGNGQWWAHAQWCESFETGAMRALLQAERPLRRCAALSLSLSYCVSVSLWRKSCAGICVSQARFEFCMNCISSLKNENKAANYLKFDNLLDPTYLCFNRLSSVPEMTSPLLEWCQLFIYVKQFDIPSPLPKAKGQMHIMRALYDLRDFYINTDTHTHTHIQLGYSYRGLAAILF